MAMENNITFDALIPPEMAIKAEEVGQAKARMGTRQTFFLAVVAGGFIAFGAVFATTVATGAGDLAYGLSRLLIGLVFSLGLILVVIAGAELFTGNNLIVMAWASRKISTRALLRNWALVYLGNFVGSILTAVLVFLSGQFTFGSGQVGLTALNIAAGKVELGFIQALSLGVLCNMLVCLAVWITLSARTTTDKILAVIPPITAFVAAGFEHSVANMFFIPIGLLIKAGAPASFWTQIGVEPSTYASLTWRGFLLDNLLPVTIGNIIGGAVLVGFVYWFIYLRKKHTL